MTRGLVMTASTRSSAPQWGQNRRSMSNTRRKRCIQFIGGDPLGWSLDRIRTRLAQVLERAGAGDVAQHVDAPALEAVLPRVSEAAYRARFHHDDEATLRGALT